jgi:hypothetical protein
MPWVGSRLRKQTQLSVRSHVRLPEETTSYSLIIACPCALLPWPERLRELYPDAIDAVPVGRADRDFTSRPT